MWELFYGDQGFTLYLPWMPLNSRHGEKNLQKGERTHWNFLKCEGRFNSDFPKADATVLFSFCPTAMSPRELLVSTSTHTNTETQMCPSQAVLPDFHCCEATPHGLIPALPNLEDKMSKSSYLPSTWHFPVNLTPLHLLTLELKATRTRSFPLWDHHKN